jgi:hypothetical protein
MRMHTHLHSGNKRHSVSKNNWVEYTEAQNGGSSVSQKYIYGDVNSNIRFPTGSLPSLFTLCTMTRYSGGAGRGRIINAFGANFVHGHDSVKRGVAYYGDKWVTGTTSVGGLDNWLVMCAKSSGRAPNNVVVDGQRVGTSDTTFTGGLQLAINTGQAGGTSDWIFAHAIVWDQLLSDDELQIIASIMMRSLTDSTVNIAAMGVCSCAGSVFCAKPTYARYHGNSWDAANKMWRDRSGNNRHTILTEGTIQVATTTGNGAQALQTYIYGASNTKIMFPKGSVPASFTMCIVSRYNGGNRGRIFVSPDNNFIWGHW